MPSACDDLFEFLEQSPTPYHAVQSAVRVLEDAGYTCIAEQDRWPEIMEGKYYVTRNDSSLIALHLSGKSERAGFRMVGAHTDSPCLKVKPNAVDTSQGYARLGVEVYGGALLNPWFDRDLSLAGRVSIRTGKGEMRNLLVDFKDPMAFIPSLAIHLDREVNENRSINKQKHLPAVLCRTGKGGLNFDQVLKKQVKAQHPGLSVSAILGFELSLYDSQPPALVGLKKEFIASARLDNLLSCHCAVQAITRARRGSNMVVVLNDHEEVGSASSSGAEGPFLLDTLSRICRSEETLLRSISRSMMVSADNAHGIHPNYPELHEPSHRPKINAGPVIKINSNQRYATNSETEAVFAAVCESAKVPYQKIVVRSDMACGSTIGPITATRLGVRTVDVGVPQLGMHSVRELAGARDPDYLVRALRRFFELRNWPF